MPGCAVGIQEMRQLLRHELLNFARWNMRPLSQKKGQVRIPSQYDIYPIEVLHAVIVKEGGRGEALLAQGTE